MLSLKTMMLLPDRVASLVLEKKRKKKKTFKNKTIPTAKHIMRLSPPVDFICQTTKYLTLRHFSHFGMNKPPSLCTQSAFRPRLEKRLSVSFASADPVRRYPEKKKTLRARLTASTCLTEVESNTPHVIYSLAVNPLHPQPPRPDARATPAPLEEGE